MDERRRLRRRYLMAEVKVRPASGEKWVEAVLMNVNRSGVGLYSVGSLRKKSKVVVKIVYREGGKKVITEEIPGEVKWTAPVGGHKAAGIEFTAKVNKASFPALVKCLEYAKRSK